MKKICTVSGKEFEITQKDLEFYERMGVPVPTLCPEERQRRRLSWRNERKLYHRTCDASGKKIISVFSSDKEYIVYDEEAWWSDSWNGKDYGQDFDFSRPFFEQWNQLLKKVPQIARSVAGNQNCDFINQGGWSKDCYMTFEGDHNEKCSYCEHIQDSRYSIDCSIIVNCELCFESLNCKNCYDLKYSENCNNCSESWFLRNCIGCQNCFGCVNLRNKQYYFLNKKYTKEAYFEKIKSLNLASRNTLENLQKEFQNFSIKFPYKSIEGVKNENSSGDYLENTQNCKKCYDVLNCQNCAYLTFFRSGKNIYDTDVFGAQKGAEFCLESHEIGDGVNNVCFSDQIWSGCYNIFYSKLCLNNSHDLFGCVGLKHAQYYILNKQYTKEEYFILREKIIEHMKKTGEWGEFFPMKLSPFGYNETVAQEYFPLEKPTKNNISNLQIPPTPFIKGELMNNKNIPSSLLDKGDLEDLNFKYNWKEEEISAQYSGPKVEIPDDIKDVDDSICEKILTCEATGKNYRIVKPELAFYRKMNLPIPRICPDERHRRRVTLRNPRKLWERTCDNSGCETKFQTTFSPDRPEKVYCGKCYLEVVN